TSPIGETAHDTSPIGETAHDASPIGETSRDTSPRRIVFWRNDRDSIFLTKPGKSKYLRTMSSRKREATGLKSALLTKRSKNVKEYSGGDSSSAAENDSKYVSAMRKADVWEFATHNEQTGKGDCKFCSQSISLSAGSTSALRKHLRKKHKKFLATENENVQPKIDETLSCKKLHT
ncbi:unnamed protein product, partial [Didymodactylos carnosus]